MLSVEPEVFCAVQSLVTIFVHCALHTPARHMPPVPQFAPETSCHWVVLVYGVQVWHELLGFAPGA
jgi:hypothetical protein